MSELQRLKGLLPPEMQSWVFVEASASVDPPPDHDRGDRSG